MGATRVQAVKNRGVRSARDFLSRFAFALRGTNGPVTYTLTSALFLRALGLIYFIAFGSLAVQMLGLYGSQGILPIADLMGRQSLSVGAIWRMPTIFWLNSGDLLLQAVPIAGALLATGLVFGFHNRILRIVLWLLYLALVSVGQDFLAYQWDYLLLEVGFIAIFSRDSNLILWLYRWLLFRLMFASGLVKILSGDPTWRNLTALDYHFETQPLPNVIGFYAYHLPAVVLQGMTVATFFIELVVPFFVFAPRRLRFAAAGLIALLQVQIFLTGNYNFFNLLTMTLCILLLDDVLLGARLPKRMVEYFTPRNGGVPRPITRWTANAIAVFLFVLSGFQLLALLRMPTPGIVSAAQAMIAPLGIVNLYGPFAVMTTTRPEIVIEGSNDGENWREYAFKFKPGDTHRAPPWVEPHQPRLDWQMWFAALGVRTSDPQALLPELRANPALNFGLQNYGVDAWFVNFMVRLLQGSPAVLALMDENPFPDAPPRFVRARLYMYRFADAAAPQRTGEWWVREERGIYLPPLTLK
ncbi:MAG: lipase maturation factor family protein [Anaerolineae bacterium]|nr:lipase maturation factor family protein [Anaerolineae bacterium]